MNALAILTTFPVASRTITTTASAMFYPKEKCYTAEMILMNSVEAILTSDIVAISSKQTNAR